MLVKNLKRALVVAAGFIGSITAPEEVSQQVGSGSDPALNQLPFQLLQVLSQFVHHGQHKREIQIVFGLEVLVDGGLAYLCLKGDFIHGGTGIAFGEKDLFGGFQDALDSIVSLSFFPLANDALMFIISNHNSQHKPNSTKTFIHNTMRKY